jgi:hypothetical protein
LPGFFFIEVFEVQQKSDLFFSKWVFNEMRTSSVSESAKIEHINLRKHQNYMQASREKTTNISPHQISKFTVFEKIICSMFNFSVVFNAKQLENHILLKVV